jgi:hypothetical protein
VMGEIEISKVPFSFIEHFVNTFLDVVFEPKRFFSKDHFSQDKWEVKAIRYWVFSFLIFFVVFNVALKEALGEIRPAELQKIFENTFPLTWPTLLFATLKQTFLWIFVTIFFSWLFIKMWKREDLFRKMINIQSYVWGTITFLFLINFFTGAFRSYLIQKLGIKIMPFMSVQTLILFATLIYSVALIVKSYRYALKFSSLRALFIGILQVIISVYFFFKII